MDIDMTDAGYDIDLGIDASIQNPAQQPQQSGQVRLSDALQPDHVRMTLLTCTV